MRKALGKGLEALIPKVGGLSSFQTVNIDVKMIEPNKYQSRIEFDEEKLRELADSLLKDGVVQPIIVTPKGDRYQLVAGERRWRAAKLAGLKEIPAIVRRLNDREMFEISLVENIQREDLNPIEEALAFDKLMEEFHLTQQELADHLGKRRSTVANSLRLLNLPQEVRELVSRNLISAGHARALLAIEGENRKIDLARRIVKEKLTVREVESIAERWSKQPATKRKIPKKESSPEIIELEEELQRILGTKVRIIAAQKGKGKREKRLHGKIEIEYYSLEDLERIIEILRR